MREERERKNGRGMKKIEKLVGIDWSPLSSPSFTYANCFSLIGDNSVSNCSRYMV